MFTLQDVLSRVRDPKPAGEGKWLAFCPCHNDGAKQGRRSLSITEKNGKILLYCFAGCSYKDIVEALGLKPEPHQEEPLAIYRYTDESGKVLFEVCRFPGKRFVQRRPDGAGGWLWNLKGVRRVLYRLPEVIAAVKESRTVFVVEGERDADNLSRLGLTATTAPGGAGKWREEYLEALHGADVVILPDNDEPGHKHAEQVAKSLHGVAARVRVLSLPGLPAKGDASNWIAAGGTKEELLRLAEEAPEWRPVKVVPLRKKQVAPEQKTSKPGLKQVENECQKKRQVSFFTSGETLFEQVCVDGKNLFLSFNAGTGETKMLPYIELEDEVVEPISGDDVTLGAVKLPSGVLEYGDTLTLLAEIEEHIYKYLDVSDSYRKFAAYYILLGWLYDRFNTLPYLRALGDTGCGKSRFLDVIGGLCYKAISASGCVTPAPIYRMLRKWGGTLVLDEADMKSSDEYNEVVTILNCGFERGRPVIRATKDNPDKIQILPVYGPKVFATRRRFKDAALEARCLTEIMQETTREDIPPILGRKFYEEQEKLRNKLLLFRLRNYFRVEPEAAADVNLDGIEPRLRQISEAFVSLFANQPEVLKDYRRFIRRHQQELIEQRAATVTGQVVAVLFDVLGQTSLSPNSIVPNVPLVPGEEKLLPISAGDIAEKLGLRPQTVGQILKGLGLQTKKTRNFGEQKRCVVYDEAKFATLRRRYIPTEDDGTTGTGGTSPVEVNEIVPDRGKEDEFDNIPF